MFYDIRNFLAHEREFSVCFQRVIVYSVLYLNLLYVQDIRICKVRIFLVFTFVEYFTVFNKQLDRILRKSNFRKLVARNFLV